MLKKPENCSHMVRVQSDLRKITQKNRARHFDKRDALDWKLVSNMFLIGIRARKSNFCVLGPFWGKYLATITSLCWVAETSLLSILSGTCGHHIPGGHFCPTLRSSQKLAIFPKISPEGQNVVFLSIGFTEKQSQCFIWTSYSAHWKVILSTFLVCYWKSGEKVKLLFSREVWGPLLKPNFWFTWYDFGKKLCMPKSWVIRCRKLSFLKLCQKSHL